MQKLGWKSLVVGGTRTRCEECHCQLPRDHQVYRCEICDRSGLVWCQSCVKTHVDFDHEMGRMMLWCLRSCGHFPTRAEMELDGQIQECADEIQRIEDRTQELNDNVTSLLGRQEEIRARVTGTLDEVEGITNQMQGNIDQTVQFNIHTQEHKDSAKKLDTRLQELNNNKNDLSDQVQTLFETYRQLEDLDSESQRYINTLRNTLQELDTLNKKCGEHIRQLRPENPERGQQIEKLSSSSVPEEQIQEQNTHLNHIEFSEVEVDLHLTGRTRIYQKSSLKGIFPATRLLTLLPGKYADMIHCKLELCTLDADPNYQALSYCWGDPQEHAVILCNGEGLDVTLNLHSALQSIRHETESKVLWVDAICINQDNVEEKSQQVSMMRSIYQKSQHTLIWLGDSSADSDRAILACERLAKGIGMNGDVTDRVRDVTLQQLISRNEFAGAPTKCETAAIARLLKRAWFSRVWVIQETAVSSALTMICGRLTIHFDTFFLGLQYCMVLGKSLSKGAASFLDGSQTLYMMREWWDRDPQALELLSLLQKFRRFHSSDERDKIFALYGLASNDLSALQLQSDYSSKPQDIYRTVTLALLKSSEDLKILEIPRGRTELRKNLPSWVPDFYDASDLGIAFTDRGSTDFGHLGLASAKRRMKNIAEDFYRLRGEEAEIYARHLGHCLDDEEHDTSPVHGPVPCFDASKASKPPLPVINEQGALCLTGHILDTIAHVGQTAIAPQVDQDELQSWQEIGDWASVPKVFRRVAEVFSQARDHIRVLLEWDELALKNRKVTYPTGETQMTAYWQTLCAGYWPGSLEEAAESFHVWRNQLRGARLLKVLNIFRAFNVNTSGKLDLLVTICATYYLNGRQRIFASMAATMFQRRLARTAKGYLELVPTEAEAGDTVAILKGGKLPLVLRARKGQWELIGESYVHGVMYGETFDEARCEAIQLI